MKKQTSIFLLFLGHSAWKVLLLLAALAGAQIGLFLAFRPGDFAAHSLEDCLKACQTPLSIALLLAFALVCGVLLADRGKGGHRLSYTLDRLSIPPRQVMACQATYNLLAWLLFWAVEALVIFALFRLYVAQGGYAGPQTLYLATWQNEWVHSFLPMEETSRWARNLVLVLGMSITGACSAAQLRHKRKAAAIFGFVGALPASFLSPMGNWQADLAMMVLYAVITAIALYNVSFLGKEDGKYEDLEME